MIPAAREKHSSSFAIPEMNMNMYIASVTETKRVESARGISTVTRTER